MTKTLNMPCTIQGADECAGIPVVIATENELGLDLHALEEEPAPEDGEPPHEVSWGRLSLAGWATLAEMWLLRHPERARKLVEKWQVLQASKITMRAMIHP